MIKRFLAMILLAAAFGSVGSAHGMLALGRNKLNEHPVLVATGVGLAAGAVAGFAWRRLQAARVPSQETIELAMQARETISQFHNADRVLRNTGYYGFFYDLSMAKGIGAIVSYDQRMKFSPEEVATKEALEERQGGALRRGFEQPDGKICHGLEAIKEKLQSNTDVRARDVLAHINRWQQRREQISWREVEFFTPVAIGFAQGDEPVVAAIEAFGKIDKKEGMRGCKEIQKFDREYWLPYRTQYAQAYGQAMEGLGRFIPAE